MEFSTLDTPNNEISGYSGASGNSNISGYSGYSGSSGASGLRGYFGLRGLSGFTWCKRNFRGKRSGSPIPLWMG